MIFLLSQYAQSILGSLLGLHYVLVELVETAARLPPVIWCKGALLKLLFNLRISLRPLPFKVASPLLIEFLVDITRRSLDFSKLLKVSGIFFY